MPGLPYTARALAKAGDLLAGRVTLPLNEVFGPTIQGEGPHTGRRCYFVRLGGCNLSCHWCDTPYTWDPTRYDLEAENPQIPTEEILDRLVALGAQGGDVVVLSGGEPLIHHPRLPRLLHPAYRWHLESNGTIWPGEDVARLFEHVTLSPKVHDQGDPEKRRLRPKALEGWTGWSFDAMYGGNVAWKFVVRAQGPDAVRLADLDAVDRLVADYGIPHHAVWLMPEGTDAEGIHDGTAYLANDAIERGYNLTTRLHTLVWGNEKGR